jgi:Ca2+-binding RTX toxin-like protein
MAAKVNPIQGTIRSLHIGDMIPDDFRGKVGGGNGTSANTTGANYLTIGAGGAMQTPNGQNVGPDVDLAHITSHFTGTVKSELAKNDTKITDSLMANSVMNNVSDRLNFDDIKTRPFTINVSDIGEAKIVNDSNQLTALSTMIAGVDQGAKAGSFVDGDEANNLIEITPQDAQKAGGLRAQGGNDYVVGTQSNDTANGNGGSDTIIGDRGDDFLRGGEGSDLIDGGEGNEMICGNRGEDMLVGGAGNDFLRGGTGHDILYGNGGNDILIGDAGSDFLMGGEGADDFILRGDFNTFDAAYADRILDFNPAEGDRIKIANLKGVEGMDQISLAAVDVNQDGIGDTAILCSCGDVVGIIMNTDPTKISVNNSIFMVGSQDITLSQMN